jgi:hypothetical protein
MRARRVEATRRARSETAEGGSRRERRHPEAFTPPVPETAGGEEAVAAGAAGTAPAEAEAPEAGSAVPEAGLEEPQDAAHGEEEKDS